ncbi:hypothetical protein [Henriciella litoralis]|uniref:hypothetical protein n=1 Tax=Henriciella litoralis TaxID=568102 RepID=UPI0009FEE294|nr:hypothetical protein [Henriciella litoralis]
MSWRRLTSAVLATSMLAGCGAVTSNSRAVFMLVDASGTYAKEVPDAVVTAKLVTSKLNSNDLIAFGQIGSCSFTDDSLIVRTTLPGTPSQAAYTKQDVFGRLDAYGETFEATSWTDIRGGLRYAAEELAQSDQSEKIIVIVSDLVEDVSPACDTSRISLDLEGVTVVATNVTKLSSEASNPDAYSDRLAMWQATVEDAGGTWVHANTRDRLLEKIF